MAGWFWAGKKCPWVKNNPQIFKKGHIPWSSRKNRKTEEEFREVLRCHHSGLDSLKE